MCWGATCCLSSAFPCPACRDAARRACSPCGARSRSAIPCMSCPTSCRPERKDRRTGAKGCYRRRLLQQQRQLESVGLSCTSAQPPSLPYQVLAVKRPVVGPIFALLEACMVHEAKQQPTAPDFISRGITQSTTASAVHGTSPHCGAYPRTCRA